MKHIIFVDGLKTEQDVLAIQENLDNTSVDYQINLGSGSVVIDGSNDKVFTAKQAIMRAGYKIK